MELLELLLKIQSGKCLGHTRANQEPIKVLLHEPACRRTAKSSCKALGSIRGLDLNAERSQNIDSP